MVETGWFYSLFIDPVLVPFRKRIKDEIEEGQQIIDIASGTGAFIFECASKVSSAVGIDLSDSMIKKARSTKNNRQIENVDFYVSDATNLSAFSDKQFDVATMSLALHQFAPELHAPILNEMKRIASKLIILDYAVPLPKNYAGRASKTAEFFAGKEHYRHFREFYCRGGLNKILPKNQLQITKSIVTGRGAFQLVVCEAAAQTKSA